MMALLNGLRGIRFAVELIENKVKTFFEAMYRAQGAMNIEEYLAPKFKQALHQHKGKVRGQNLEQRKEARATSYEVLRQPKAPKPQSKERFRIQLPGNQKNPFKTRGRSS